MFISCLYHVYISPEKSNMFIHTHIICGSDRSIQPDIGEPGALPGRINVHQAYDPTGLGPWGNDRSCGTSLDQSLHSVHQSAGAPGTFDQSGLFSQKYSVLVYSE